MDRVLTVSKLNNYIKGVFEDELILHNIVVSGEILQQRVSGNNSFFLLKEGDDTISCVFFSSAFVYPIGAEVEVLGTVEYYRRTGQISFVAKNVVVKGKGKLQQKLLLAKASLQAEGIFENARPFPLLIKKVAFISSESGAVIHDFYSVLSVSAPYVLADCFSVRVQGEDAAMQILSTLKEVNKQSYDLIVIARGGGSKEDLKEFNSETLARGVHDSLIPVLSAIGHESDYTLTDFAADKRAGTPSIAAEMIAKNNNSFFSYYFSSLGRIYKNLILQSNSDGRRLSNLISRLYYRLNGISLQARQQVYKNNFRLIRAVENKFEKSKERLKKALEKINRSIIRQCENRSHQISMLQIKLNQLNPSKVLSGGYAIVFKENERLLSVKDVSKDDELEINLSDGKITVRVIK